MTRTRSSSPGRTAGFTAFASELMFMTRTPCSSATRLRLKSLVRIDPAPRAGQRDQLGVDLGDVRDVVLDDLDRRRRVLLHAVEDLEPAAAAVAAERVGAVGDVLELVEHEPRDDQRAVDEAGLDDLGDPAVDDGARVHDDLRIALAGAARRSAVRRPEEPDRLGGDEQVLALGDGQAEHPEAEEDRDAQRQQRTPAGRAEPDSGKPSRRPISRPDEQADDRGDELGRREGLDPRGSATPPGRP